MGASPFERLIAFIVVPVVIGLIAIGFASVCLRYLFQGEYALFWSEELIRYGFIWVFWLVSPLLILKGVTFNVDLLTSMLHERTATGLRVILNVGIVALLAVYAWQGVAMTRLNWVQLSTALEVPIGWFYLAIPVGSVLMIGAVVWETLGLLGFVRREPQATVVL